MYNEVTCCNTDLSWPLCSLFLSGMTQNGSCLIDGFIVKKILGLVKSALGLGLFNSNGGLLQLGSMATLSSC